MQTSDRLTAADFDAMAHELFTDHPTTSPWGFSRMYMAGMVDSFYYDGPTDDELDDDYESACRDFYHAVEGAVRELPIATIRAYTGHLAQIHDNGSITCNDLTDWYVKHCTYAYRCRALKRALGV